MSDREDSPSKSDANYSDNGSPKASRSRSRSHSRKRYRHSRSRSFTKKHYYSRSRSRSPYYKHSRKSRHSHSRSRSYSPRYHGYRKHDGESRRGYRSRSRSPMSSRRRHQGTRENPRSSNCVGVFGLSLYTQERDLRDAFGRYGPIDEVQVVYDHQTGRSRGFAFMYFKNIEDAEEAKERAPGTEIDGRKIRVDYSITERAHTPTPGIYLGKPTGSGYRGRSRRSPSPYHRSRRGYSRSRSRSRSYSPRRY